ncbi:MULTISPECIES: type II toxin-antitoxin system RelE/ParE family toxin [Burkholderiaceae]|uniref:type II toxin-antitoxin system RelE family toxin n=1 Tax=Burkholderiaceae TaxID=119060 RepID=UPI00095A091A|nr:MULTISPECIES: type II toxin-antitoxin system RelE/ParE family toxin [Burkholderiaceae]MCF2133604.1 type II toxin-antitoxin system RelE/ParE family toxin [Mycetohabitans sp. B3]MCG1039157.1 type II toxin-antitoxin system RelE/ParE family toxin [Mycetohabitans sp. B7]SIT67597.1 mRNA interferase RelE/StbE [Burkholderia sp. b14]
MAWQVKVETAAAKELKKLGPPQAERVLRFLFDRVAKLDDPRSMGEALKGVKLGEFWEYRVGDYRVIAKIQDDELLILVVRIGNRRAVYK